MAEENLVYKELKKVQSAQLLLLRELDRVCTEEGIKYFIIGGTALGAYRHKGFIPWDDDIDVGMCRQDYTRFLERANSILAEDIFIQNPRSDPYSMYLYTKMRKNGTVFSQSNEYTTKMHKGIYIDIFPFDEIPASNLLRNVQFYLIKMAIILFYFKQCSVPALVGKGGGYKLRFFRAKLMHKIMRPIKKECLINFYEKLAELSFSKKSDIRSCLFFPRQLRESVYNNDISPVGHIEFEGELYPCPRKIERYLENHYGNFMEIPPPHKRINHHPSVIEI